MRECSSRQNRNETRKQEQKWWKFQEHLEWYPVTERTLQREQVRTGNSEQEQACEKEKLQVQVQVHSSKILQRAAGSSRRYPEQAE
jgi:hypothetical protein